jgi:hypothetical protein
MQLRGMVAPQRGEQCHAADGTGFGCGTAAADALAALMRDNAVVVLSGWARGGQT